MESGADRPAAAHPWVDVDSDGTMHAVVFQTHGTEDVLEYREVPRPVPGRGEVRVRVAAAGVNRLDLDIRAGVSGYEHPFPHVLGREAAGRVDRVGEGVDSLSPGDRVVVATASCCGHCDRCRAGRDNLCPHIRRPGLEVPGGYAEYVVVPEADALALAEDIPFDQAASLLVSYGTAWRALVTLARVQPGEAVLVVGAGGGVGTAAVQVGAACGAEVIASAGSDEKVALARELGATAAINYRSEDLVPAVKRETGGRGVAVAFEHVGGDTFLSVLGCMSEGGRIVTLGAHAGETVPFELVPFFRSELSLYGSRGQSRSDLRGVLRLTEQGKLRPHVGERFPLRRVADAHRLLAARGVSGKIVLEP